MAHHRDWDKVRTQNRMRNEPLFEERNASRTFFYEVVARPATDAQKGLAASLAKKLGIPEPDHEDRIIVSAWIDRHLGHHQNEALVNNSSRPAKSPTDKAATTAQKQFAACIARKLRVQEPDYTSRAATSKWIDEHKPAFEKRRKRKSS